MGDPVQPAGPVPDLVPAPVPVPIPEEVCCSSLLFLWDILSDKEFLVDSGASVWVFPGPKSTSINRVCHLTANRTLMMCSKSCIIPLCFSCNTNSPVYSWNFQLAPVSVLLLEADFLQHFNLIFNIKGWQVVHADCPEYFILRASLGSVPAFSSVSFFSTPQCVQKLPEDFPNVLSSEGFTAQNLIISSPTPVLLFSPNLGGWIRRSYLPPRRSSPPWIKQ